MAEIQQEVVSIAKKFNLPVETWYSMLQSERGLTKAQYHRDILYPMLALKKLAGTEIEITPEDLKHAFERDYGPRMQGRMALVDGNIRQANDIWEKFKKDPENFDRLARDFSSDSNTRALGGAIPPIRKYGSGWNKNNSEAVKREQKLELEAFRLKAGEISALIQVGENKYCILKCEGFTDQIVTGMKEVEQDLRQGLIEEKTQEAVAVVFKEIKDKASVHNFLEQSSTVGGIKSGIQKTSGTKSSAKGTEGKDRVADEDEPRPRGTSTKR